MVLLSFFALLGIFLLFPLLIAIVLYVVMSIGLSKLAVNAGIENPWLAWVPFAKLYILGRLIPELKVLNYIIPSHEIVLPTAALCTFFFGKTPLIGFLIGLSYLVTIIATMYTLFKRYVGEKALMYTIIGVLTCGAMLPVFVYIICDKKPIYK